MRSSSQQGLRRLAVLGARSNGLVRAGCALFQFGSCSFDGQRSRTHIDTQCKCHLSTVGPTFGGPLSIPESRLFGIELRAPKTTLTVASGGVKPPAKFISSQVCCSQRNYYSHFTVLLNLVWAKQSPSVLQATAKEGSKPVVDDAHKRFASADKINIKAQLVFEACWRKLETKWSGVR